MLVIYYINGYKHNGKARTCAKVEGADSGQEYKNERRRGHQLRMFWVCKLLVKMLTSRLVI